MNNGYFVTWQNSEKKKIDYHKLVIRHSTLRIVSLYRYDTIYIILTTVLIRVDEVHQIKQLKVIFVTEICPRDIFTLISGFVLNWEIPGRVWRRACSFCVWLIVRLNLAEWTCITCFVIPDKLREYTRVVTW